MSSSTHTEKAHNGHGKMLLLVLGSLGVVFGDIGTSPLYAINEMFFGHGEIPVTPENIYGSISLVVWAITLVVCFKYLTFVLRADNDGEGGVFALYGLLNTFKKHSVKILMLVLMLSAGLLFGDGIITPAISVLSAVEGLRVAAPALGDYVVPITVAILTGLFAIQFKGTAKVGTIFGPIVTIWFICLALLGINQIIDHPEIFYAFNPIYGLKFLHTLGWQGSLLLLGAVMLVITGGEALYADMGHFGKKSIRIGWFSLVYPALILNYLGQGAYLLTGRIVQDNNI